MKNSVVRLHYQPKSRLQGASFEIKMNAMVYKLNLLKRTPSAYYLATWSIPNPNAVVEERLAIIFIQKSIFSS